MMEYVAITNLLDYVMRLLDSHVDLISGAEKELRLMKNDLELLHELLRDAVDRQDESYREMDSLIWGLVYEAEDTIDSCLTQMAAANEMNIFHRYLNKKHGRLSPRKAISYFTRDRLVPMVDSITIANRFPIRVGSDKLRAEDKEVPSIRLNNVVGFEEEAETLINYLTEEKESLAVISITGMPGIGKTALAWKIYQDEKIQEEFPIRIWVDVPQKFHLYDWCLKILKDLPEEHNFPMSVKEITDTVRACLENKRFLLVIEDVWAIDIWNAIKDVLTMSNKRGKVLITSCNVDVCMHASSPRKPHVMRFLNVKESWELLQLEVFGKLQQCPQWLKSPGECIAKMCDGLPLAIEVIGSSLVVGTSTTAAKRLTEQWWEKVSKNVTMYVKDYEQHCISGIVALSYNKLPIQLRDCFLYLGVFPEDYEISAWTLTCLWIAEGFIQHNESSGFEKIAKENLRELIQNNLVMVDKISPEGEVKTCRVHKVIHGFCKSKAAEMNLFQEIKMYNKGVFDPPVSLTPNYRRLCIYSHLSEFLSREPNGPGIRSFLCFNKEPLVLDPKYNSAIQKSFNLIRVLECKSIKFTKFPLKLNKVMHLRYISLCCDDLCVLPESISKLWNLQTLVVETQSPSLVIKGNIWGMIQLRHLITKAAIILANQEKGEGEASENLQTLSRLSPKNCSEDVFRRAHNLERLGIRGQLATLLDAESLRQLYCVKRLKLVNDSLCELASDNQLHRLLRPNCFPPNLMRLTLSATLLDWEHMALLGKINTLKILKLKNNAFTGASWNTDADGFFHLNFLFIESTDLVSWEAVANCFPHLNCLVLKNCEKLGRIPLSLAKSLQILDMKHVSETAVESAWEIKEEVRMQGQENGRLPEFKLTIRPGHQ